MNNSVEQAEQDQIALKVKPDLALYSVQKRTSMVADSRRRDNSPINKLISQFPHDFMMKMQLLQRITCIKLLIKIIEKMYPWLIFMTNKA